MTTLLMTHPDCIRHDPGSGHPESPGRLSAVLKALEEPQFKGLIRRDAPLGRETDIARVHGDDFMKAVLARVPPAGRAALDPDTIVSPASGHAALSIHDVDRKIAACTRSACYPRLPATTTLSSRVAHTSSEPYFFTTNFTVSRRVAIGTCVPYAATTISWCGPAEIPVGRSK